MAVWIILAADGSVLEQVSGSVHPLAAPAAGAYPAYDAPPERVHEVDRKGDLAVESFVPGQGWVMNLEALRDRTLAVLDRRRQEVEARLSPRRSHSRKREEIVRYRQEGLEAGVFPWLSREADERGETLEATAARVQAQVEAEEDAVAGLEAALITAKHAARTASTPAALLDLIDEWSDSL